MIRRILEKLFNLEPEVCSNCQFLMTIIEQERRDKIAIIANLTKGEKEEQRAPIPQTQIPISARIPWSVQRQQLEQADKLRYENELANRAAKLEDELKINEN